MATSLIEWFAIWHPRYRGILVQLAVAAALAAGLVFVQQTFLDLLTLSLAPNEPTSPAGPVSDLTKMPTLLSDLAVSLGIGLPFLVLGLFILARVFDAAIDHWRAHAGGRLKVRTGVDMEAEILMHLLRKDDTFFARHSPAETVNRLAVDLYRVGARRTNLVEVWWSALAIVGSLAFFVSKDWRLALVALAGCLAGALWTRYMTRHVKEMDADYLRHDDCVKSNFEDYLRASPEVQVGGLYERVRARFHAFQEERTRVYMRYVRLNALLGVGGTVSYLLAFVAMVLVVLYMRSTGSMNAALALVPVVIYALPRLFNSASSLVFLNLEFELARTSMKRLLEYETQGPPGHLLTAEAPQGQLTATRQSGVRLIAVESATYRYSGPDGSPLGGVTEVATTFAPGSWVAVVGGAGSGKSTLLKLLLGRVTPQRGRVLYGGAPIHEMPVQEMASVFTVMPQSPSLLNATIRENLLFGRPWREAEPGAAGPLSDDDVDVIERAGLGPLCRLKALDILPAGGAGFDGLRDGIAGIRFGVRDRLFKTCGLAVLPYESGHGDPKNWVLECLLGGRCDRNRAVDRLLGKSSNRPLQRLMGTDLGNRLFALGRTVLREQQHLLCVDNYAVFSRLAPFPLDERVWQLRRGSVHLAECDRPSPVESLAGFRIVLTALPAELAGDESPDSWVRPGLHERFPDEQKLLRDLLGDAFSAFAADEIHPYLTWRENLVFGAMELGNSRAARLADQVLVESVSEGTLRRTFTHLGLDYPVGRLGGNLSGGQGQLVALGRSLLRRTPVLVLDEPTSNLDPASRTRVTDLLRAWKDGRIVITVSHDPEFIRQADEIRLMDGGRLVASGTFEKLKEESELFRKTLAQA